MAEQDLTIHKVTQLKREAERRIQGVLTDLSWTTKCRVSDFRFEMADSATVDGGTYSFCYSVQIELTI